jgi:hypothetical protein
VNAVEIQEFKLILQSSPFCEQIPRNMKLIQRGNHFKEGLIFSVGAEQSREESDGEGRRRRECEIEGGGVAGVTNPFLRFMRTVSKEQNVVNKSLATD